MRTLVEAIDCYRELAFSDRLLFYATLSNDIQTDQSRLEEFLIESRFKNSVTCIHCITVRFYAPVVIFIGPAALWSSKRILLD